MTVKDRRRELLLKAEQYKSSLLLNNNYDKLTDIITGSRWDHLESMCDILLRIMNVLQNLYQLSNDDKSSIGYERYRYQSVLANLRLNILYCKMRHESVKTYMHRYAGMRYLSSKGYMPEHIECLINTKEGKPDYITKIDGQGHEMKFLDRNVICFTTPQIINFDEGVNIAIFERIRYDVYIHELVNIGYRYRETVKFRDIINRKVYLPYKIIVKDSDFRSALNERYKTLDDRRKQKTIDDSW